jgi:hypothetical protein
MPPGSKSVRLGLALLLAAVSFPATAPAGAWTTYLRAEIYSDLVAQGDTIWCASLDGGLLRYLPAADRFESIAREPGGLASQALTVLEFDRAGRLWVGSLDRGVSRLSPDGKSWDLISELDGLPAGEVHVLRTVGDTMLIGTERGIALWNGREIVGAVPEGVNPSPFASDAISGLVLRGDSLWVSTAKGVREPGAARAGLGRHHAHDRGGRRAAGLRRGERGVDIAGWHRDRAGPVRRPRRDHREQ